MRRFILPGLIALAAAGLLATLAFGVSQKSDISSLDSKVAKGTFPLTPGRTLALPKLGSEQTADLAAYRGKIVVLNMYASWCDPCRTEAPLLAREQKLLVKHNATVLGVTYQDSSNSTESFDRRYGITYPVLRDVNGALARALGTHQVPETFIINRQGKVQALRRYQIDAAWLNDTLKPMLTGATAS